MTERDAPRHVPTRARRGQISACREWERAQEPVTFWRFSWSGAPFGRIFGSPVVGGAPVAHLERVV